MTYDENTAGAKSPEGRTKKKKNLQHNNKKENRSFFPNGGIQPNNNEALGGTGSNNALVRSLLAQSLKQPLRPRNGGNVVTAAMGGYGEWGWCWGWFVGVDVVVLIVVVWWLFLIVVVWWLLLIVVLWLRVHWVHWLHWY